MKKNMGMTERNIRGAGGIIALAAGGYFFYQGEFLIGVILWFSGVSLILEALYRWCPAKAYLGLGKKYHED